MRSALVLLRTPLQAWLAERVLRQKHIDRYDILYITKHLSEEDIYYFNKMKQGASKSFLDHIRPANFDFFQIFRRKIEFYSFFGRKDYDFVLLASIDDFVFSWAALKFGKTILTFDDGLANFNMKGIYHIEPLSFRGRVFRYLLGASSYKKLKPLIAEHYTLHPEMPNIVERNRRHQIRSADREFFVNSSQTITFFLGAPLESVLSSDQISRMRSASRRYKVDYYVKHPREENIVLDDVPILKKNGQIAEDAIAAKAQGRRVRIVGWISTVMFNISSKEVEKIVLLPSDDPRSVDFAHMAQRFGCEVVEV